MRRLRIPGRISKRQALIGGGLVVLIVGVFVGGYLMADDSGEVSELHDQIANVESERDETEYRLSESEAEASEAQEELGSTREQLQAERSLNGKLPVKEGADQEYDTDYPWEAAGKVGYLTIKPIDITQEDSRWILTVEAKNEGSEPKLPFCGDAGAALGNSEGNTYTGEALLSDSSDSCGEELQPGLTGTFKSEFKLPEGTKPVVAVIYGDYEQEEEAKSWELP
jgi:hypothetical protein